MYAKIYSLRLKLLRVLKLQQNIQAIFEQVGFDKANADIIARMLSMSESKGIKSHGILRIPDYLDKISTGEINVKPNIKLIKESPGTGLLDADSTMGAIAATQAMSLAIDKARQVGTGMLGVRNSTHFGIGAFYSEMALEHNMIGFALTNSIPYVAPTGSSIPMLGTNPIAYAFPVKSGPPFSADFSTSSIAKGKLSLLQIEKRETPLNVVQDSEGKPTTDPSTLIKGGSILPLGGDIEHGGHKGYALASIVDILSGVLTSANFGMFANQQGSPNGSGIGHFLGAIKVDAFMDIEEFKNRMELWIDAIHSSPTTPGVEKVLIPGEIEWQQEQMHNEQGIEIDHKIIELLKESLQKYNISSDLINI